MRQSSRISKTRRLLAHDVDATDVDRRCIPQGDFAWLRSEPPTMSGAGDRCNCAAAWPCREGPGFCRAGARMIRRHVLFARGKPEVIAAKIAAAHQTGGEFPRRTTAFHPKSSVVDQSPDRPS
ncbi:MAG: hypothetical protein AAFV69_12350 [Pseudomonadota bacterium]